MMGKVDIRFSSRESGGGVEPDTKLILKNAPESLKEIF